MIETLHQKIVIRTVKNGKIRLNNKMLFAEDNDDDLSILEGQKVRVVYYTNDEMGIHTLCQRLNQKDFSLIRGVTLSGHYMRHERIPYGIGLVEERR